MVRQQIQFWKNRGITACDAWEALGYARVDNARWGSVHYAMVRWLLKSV